MDAAIFWMYVIMGAASLAIPVGLILQGLRGAQGNKWTGYTLAVVLGTAGLPMLYRFGRYYIAVARAAGHSPTAMRRPVTSRAVLIGVATGVAFAGVLIVLRVLH